MTKHNNSFKIIVSPAASLSEDLASDREENTDSAYRTVHPGKEIGDEDQHVSSEEEALDKASNAEVDKDSEDEVSLPKSVKPVATHSRKSLLSTLTR